MKLNDSIFKKEPILGILDEITNHLSEKNTGLDWILRYPRHIPTPQQLCPINPIKTRKEEPVVNPY